MEDRLIFHINANKDRWCIEVPENSSNHKVEFHSPYFHVSYDLPSESGCNITGGFPLRYKDFGGKKKYPLRIDITREPRKMGLRQAMYLEVVIKK